MNPARRQRLAVVGLAWCFAQALSVLAWILATALGRHLSIGRPAEFHGFLGWLSWDGGFYRVIAQHGYQLAHPDQIRFFPLYPWAAKLLSFPLGGNTDLALIVLANGAAIAAAWGIHALVLHEGFSLRVANRAVWIWFLFPGSFVLTWGYSEALFVAFAVWGIWAMRRHNWWSAALLFLLAGMTRPLGVALVFAACAEIVSNHKGRREAGQLGRIAAVVAGPLGAGIFGGYAAWRGFGFFRPVTIQNDFRESTTPLSWLWNLPETLRGHEAFTSGLHLPFVLLSLGLLVITFRRLPACYGAFAAGILLIALSAHNLNSTERYAMSAFPLAMGAAIGLDKQERLEPGVYAGLGAVSLALTTLALLGVYVP